MSEPLITKKPIPLVVLDRFENIIIDFKKNNKITQTKPGSVKYLLYGPEKSRQSISIKMGKIIGECFTKLLIEESDFEIQECGILKLNDTEKKKDFDMIWIDKKNNILYYRECKGNMDLDTEKLPATIEKVKTLSLDLEKKYPGFKINMGILNWSIYERTDGIVGSNSIKLCEKKNIRVDHFKDFLDILMYEMSKDDFYKYFRKLGKIIG